MLGKGLTAIVCLLGLAASGSVAPTQAQDRTALQNSMVDIAYQAPTDPALTPIYSGLQHRQVLEELRQFLAPLQLTRRLSVATQQCGTTNPTYDPAKSFVPICYEWVQTIIKLAPADVTPDGFSREDAITGAFVEIVLHEVALAVIDQFNAPVFGREQDAADQLAAFIMVQFGPDTARRSIAGSAYFFQAQSRLQKPTSTDFAAGVDVAAQRFYNYLCIAYGSDPQSFILFIQKKLLPQGRSVTCPHEYQQVRYAFAQTILPHVDQKLMALVQTHQWLLPTDGK